MNIEEKSKEYIDSCIDNIESHIGKNESRCITVTARIAGRCSFIAGANWMLEKAIDFIKRHDGKMIICQTEDEKDSFLYDFRKAMEE